MSFPDSEHTSSPDTPLDPYSISQLYKLSKTAGLAAILSLINVVLGIIGFFKKPAILAQAEKEGLGNEQVPLATAGSPILFIIISSIVNLMLLYFLYKFSSLTKRGIQTTDAISMENGFKSLSNYFRIIYFILLFAIVISILSSIAMMAGVAVG